MSVQGDIWQMGTYRSSTTCHTFFLTCEVLYRSPFVKCPLELTCNTFFLTCEVPYRSPFVKCPLELTCHTFFLTWEVPYRSPFVKCPLDLTCHTFFLTWEVPYRSPFVKCPLELTCHTFLAALLALYLTLVSEWVDGWVTATLDGDLRKNVWHISSRRNLTNGDL